MGSYDGSGDAMFLDDVPQSYGRAPLPDQLDKLLPYVERAIARLPVLETAGIQNVTSSPMPYPEDLPLIGPAGGLQNLWLAEGTPFGITLAGGIGWQLAEWMAEREPSIDLRSCDSRRFGRWAGRKWSARKVEEAYEHTYILPKPGEELQAARGLRCSPLHDLLDARGAVFGSVLGWEIPNWFAPPGIGREETWSFDRPNWFAIAGEECRCPWRTPVATDVSSDTRPRLTGPEAKSVLEDLMNTPAPEPGTVQPGYVLDPSGTVALGLPAACHAPGCFSLTCAPDAEAYALDLVNRAIAARDARVENVTGRIGGLHLFGKGCDALLSDLTGGARDGLATGGTCRAGIGYCPVKTSRTGFCGLPGWRIEAATKYMRVVFLALEERGARLIGARALAALRVEHREPAWPAELSADTSPGDAGLGGNAGNRRLVHLRVTPAKGAPLAGEPIRDREGRIAGSTTSGSWGHLSGAGHALGFVDRCADTSALEVQILNIWYPAENGWTALRAAASKC